MSTPILIQIDWPFFLGLIGSLILIAWYSNGRFTRLETSMDWVKDTLKDLKVTSDNAVNPVFMTRSPVNLNQTGESWLLESGLKDYIDTHKENFLKLCEEKKYTNPYEVQIHTFKVLDGLVFKPTIEDKLKKFAYEKGTTMAIIRRVGGIYLRNLCLENFNMNKEDIDRHDPKTKKES